MRTEPYICPVCCAEPGNYYGRLRFEDEAEAPECPNHKTVDPVTKEVKQEIVLLIPVSERKP